MQRKLLVALVTALLVAGLLVVVGLQYREVQSLKAKNRDLIAQGQASEAAITRLGNDLLENQKKLAHPSLDVWTAETRMDPGSYASAAVPDTFDMTFSFNADMPVRVSIMTIWQFADFVRCGRSCITGSYADWAATTSLPPQVFKLAEGCASYVDVFEATKAGILRPIVSITYNPSKVPTGSCATN